MKNACKESVSKFHFKLSWSHKVCINVSKSEKQLLNMYNILSDQFGICVSEGSLPSRFSSTHKRRRFFLYSLISCIIYIFFKVFFFSLHKSSALLPKWSWITWKFYKFIGTLLDLLLFRSKTSFRCPIIWWHFLLMHLLLGDHLLILAKIFKNWGHLVMSTYFGRKNLF